jgi:hypothetical protein
VYSSPSSSSTPVETSDNITTVWMDCSVIIRQNSFMVDSSGSCVIIKEDARSYPCSFRRVVHKEKGDRKEGDIS